MPYGALEHLRAQHQVSPPLPSMQHLAKGALSELGVSKGKLAMGGMSQQPLGIDGACEAPWEQTRLWKQPPSHFCLL